MAKPKKKKAAAKKKKAAPLGDNNAMEFEPQGASKGVDRRNSLERAAISSRYQKKTQLEHIMLRPDT